MLEDLTLTREPQAREEAATITNAGPTNNSVLVVEDNAEIRGLLLMFLCGFGYQPEFVSDGDRALRHVEHADPPGVVLLDRMLPGVTGDAVLEAIRANPTWADVPVIVLSARTDLDEMTQTMLAGADAYLTKPFQASQLIQVVEKFIRK